MTESSPLTSRYKSLQQADRNAIDLEDRPSAIQWQLDRLYHQIVSKPVLALPDAIDKLAFADHCLTEEYDVKEASTLIREVAVALLALHESAAESEALLPRRDIDPDDNSG